MEKYDVKLYDLNRACELEGAVYADEGESSDDIILKITVENNAVTAGSEGYFTAYQELRDKLLEKGLGLRCSGSLINAVQSAMMAYSPKIYLVEPGKQALMKDVVNIWDYCDITDFPDTKKQEDFADKWRRSHRG